MRPEELLPRNLTLSIGSRVPPAVTSTLRPAQLRPARDPPAPSAARTSSQTASSSAGSARRPTPCSPGVASRPLPGGTILTPRARRTSRLACTAGCSYMWLFIAGATISGQVAASAQLPRRLSARP